MTDDDYCVHGLFWSVCFTCGREKKHAEQTGECKVKSCWCRKIPSSKDQITHNESENKK